jgi:hypothetical protein
MTDEVVSLLRITANKTKNIHNAMTESQPPSIETTAATTATAATTTTCDTTILLPTVIGAEATSPFLSSKKLIQHTYLYEEHFDNNTIQEDERQHNTDDQVSETEMDQQSSSFHSISSMSDEGVSHNELLNRRRMRTSFMNNPSNETLSSSTSMNPPHVDHSKEIDTTNMSLSDVICLVMYQHPNLNAIDLRDRSLKDNDVTQLVDALEPNKIVKQLLLSGNDSITNESVPALADLIEYNSSLQVLHLGGTGITDCHEFVCALENNHQLDTFVLPPYATKKEKELCEQLLKRNQDNNNTM